MQGKLLDPGSAVRETFVCPFPMASLSFLLWEGLERKSEEKCLGFLSASLSALQHGKSDLVALSEVLCTQAPTTTQENSAGGIQTFF